MPRPTMSKIPNFSLSLVSKRVTSKSDSSPWLYFSLLVLFLFSLMFLISRFCSSHYRPRSQGPWNRYQMMPKNRHLNMDRAVTDEPMVMLRSVELKWRIKLFNGQPLPFLPHFLGNPSVFHTFKQTTLRCIPSKLIKLISYI